jgi:hypothetical protein
VTRAHDGICWIFFLAFTAHLVWLPSHLIHRYRPSNWMAILTYLPAWAIAEKSGERRIDENVESVNRKCDALSELIAENRDSHGESDSSVPNLRGADRLHSSKNDRDRGEKKTNKKNKMGTWCVSAFQIDINGLTQISKKSRRYFERAVSFQCQRELRCRNIFALQRGICVRIDFDSYYHFFSPVSILSGRIWSECR